MNRKNAARTLITFIFAGVLVVGYLAVQPSYRPAAPSGGMSIDEAAREGLHIEAMTVSSGLIGWYERGDYVIYFGSKRGTINPWIERVFFEAPYYETEVIIADNKGLEFSVRGGRSGKDSLKLPSNKKPSVLDQSSVNFILMEEMIEILKRTTIESSLDYEYDAIVSGNTM